MSSFNGKRLPPISDDEKFEKFAADLWGSLHPGASISLNGRSGQAQDGVDVVVQTGDRVIGVQCKATTNLQVKILDKEVQSARAFPTPLSELVLVTTAPHDAKLVGRAAAITEEHRKAGLFRVSYHGWDDLERLLEDHQDVVRKHFPEFVRPARSPGADRRGSAPTLHVDADLSIPLSDEELALFCSEASWALKQDPVADLRIEQADQQWILARIAELEGAASLDKAARTERSHLREMLASFAPKIRNLEIAAQLLLTNESVRSPWLIGGCWPDTAAALRRLVPLVLRGSRHVPGGLSLKISPRDFPDMIGHIDLTGEDRQTFLSQCDAYTPNYYLGDVVDLGSDLAFRYALPAGLAGLVRYSTSHEVAPEKLRAAGATLIFGWTLYLS